MSSLYRSNLGHPTNRIPVKYLFFQSKQKTCFIFPKKKNKQIFEYIWEKTWSLNSLNNFLYLAQ